MRVVTQTILAVAILGIAASMGPPAKAGFVSKEMYFEPSMSCQLSIPTIDTAVRPKATGFRNEGANAFVICGTGAYANGSAATELELQLAAFDGVTHGGVSCTGVNRQSNGSLPVYSTKQADVTPSGVSITWGAADINFGGFASSVTCNLPSGVSITGVRLTYLDEIGA